MTTRVYAFGHDKYWLEALRKVKLEDIVLEIVYCSSECLSDCLHELPRADPNALVLIDIFSHQESVGKVLLTLRSQGWRNIVVIAADPSVKESRDVFRQRRGLDYWNKTYEATIIQAKIEKCLKDMKRINNSDEKEHPLPGA
jgi:hypothetical protein